LKRLWLGGLSICEARRDHRVVALTLRLLAEPPSIEAAHAAA
jgi:hypothetical protein